ADYMDSKSARRLDRSLQYGVAAARLAAMDAKIDYSKIDADRSGVVEATSLSNNEAAYETKAAFLKKGYRSVSVSALINGYAGGGSGEIANELGVKGHAITMSSSSASGNDAMGYALSMIQHEDVDVMIAGGAEAPLIESVWGGFCLNKVMTRHSDDPPTAMRPFDTTRDGFLLGEGAGFLVLEELTHALCRGAKIYAELLAHGRSCEAYHPIAPHPEGQGYVRAMEKAMRAAQVHPTEVDYINAHGTATEANDLVETRAIKHFFGPHARNLAISSTKPITGHLMAGAGALETIICALAIKNQEIPMTRNLTRPGDECDLDYVANKSRPYPINVALNLNSGFGGKNSCLILRRYTPEQ
ncbi:MAG TPA: beta-ketoacyl-[acyl-carrier-protein] synthase family protein, partial [Chthoniobacteraceae bacterium]|nr:beta-ketoacyl-[acyl-carrier-protein] synthase family protein [Chthoniobacteraceae bacterium]